MKILEEQVEDVTFILLKGEPPQGSVVILSSNPDRNEAQTQARDLLYGLVEQIEALTTPEPEVYNKGMYEDESTDTTGSV